MSRFYFSIFLVFFGLYTLNAQRWKSERSTIVASVGTTQFLGDLGGGLKEAAHFFGVRDIDFVKTRPFVGAMFRYRIIEEVAAKAGISWGILAASDETSGSEGRKLRNLSFTSNIIQFSLHGEYYFLKEKSNPRYSFSSLRSIRNFSAYVFTGVSVSYFNPKAELDGVKYDLQPLRTEGQGLEGNAAPYSKIAIGWPLGLGAKYGLSKNLSIGIEISNTYTNSDYIDDAHDTYYDNNAIRTNYGDVAATLADRHLNPDGSSGEPYASGQKFRGSPNYNDAYILTVITLTYKLKGSTSGLPKF